ncbi:MAG TPA: hypothetical protein ENK93_02160 [Campylobacteraceae bacterium]|nr:hypothetical protein [Campylobacteraceae bacterium]
MIGQLARIAGVDALLGKLETARFNALLPVTIEVLEELAKPDKSDALSRYRLLIGKKELETKSAMPLEQGTKYWGVMKESGKNHAITLSQLLQKPKLLQNRQLVSILPAFTPQKLAHVMSAQSPKTEMKMQLLEHLSGAQSKQEFMTLANMITALQQDLFTMLLKYQDRHTLFQFKKRRTQSQTSSEDGMIDFYAAFEHIGPVEGVVEVQGDSRRLTLYLYYEESMVFLQNELETLGFEGRLLPKKAQIKPLCEPVSSLLDIKG